MIISLNQQGIHLPLANRLETPGTINNLLIKQLHNISTKTPKPKNCKQQNKTRTLYATNTAIATAEICN